VAAVKPREQIGGLPSLKSCSWIDSW